MDKRSSNEATARATPAATSIRLTAFMMDFLLLHFTLQLINNSFGDLQANLQRYLELSMDPETDPLRLETFIRESGTDEMLPLVLLFFICHFATPIAYFYFAEKYFSGRTLGKATFSLVTIDNENKEFCTQTQVFVRSLLKGLSCSIIPLGVVSFCILKFVKGKKCIHDLASRTTSIQAGSKTAFTDQA